MLHPNRFRFILFSLTIGVLAFAYSAHGQVNNANSSVYLRYFVLESDSFEEDVPTKLERALAQHEAIKLERACTDKNQLLFSVKADYPRRIQAISDEIASLFAAQAKRKEVKSVAPIALNEISNFCN